MTNPFKRVRTLPWKVYLTERTSGLVLHELSLLASQGGKIPYAAKSLLVEALLKDWLDGQSALRAEKKESESALRANVVKESH